MSDKKEMLVVSSKAKAKVKNFMEEYGVKSIGKDGLEALNEKIHSLLSEAASKAQKDKRATIKARHFESED